MLWLKRSWYTFSLWWGNLIPYGADISFVTSWLSESPFCPTSPAFPRKPSGSPRTWPSFNSLPRAVAISSVFLQTWRQFVYFSSKECKYCCVGVFLFFFLSDVTNICAAPYKPHLVLSLQPRISGCPTLPFKAAKQITNQADWDL